MSSFGSAKCVVCKKTAYPQESTSYDKQIFHLTCFKCLECRGSLQISSVAMYQGAAYCKNCFVKLFKRRGRYSVFTQEKDEVVEVEVEGDDPRAGLPSVTEEEKAEPTTPKEPLSPTEKPDVKSIVKSVEKTEPTTPKSPKEPVVKPVATYSAPAPAATPTGSSVSKGFGPRCKKCEKSAYPEESIKYDGILYHNACFRCKECKSSLTVKNVAQFQGEVFCKNCFVRMFKNKGNYNVFKEGSTGAPMEPVSPTSAS